MIEARVIAHSVSPKGKSIITFQLKYPRFIHAEVLTHRVFSRNASSSRAIPVKTMLAQVWNDPAMPIHWGINQPGMQAKDQAYGLRRRVAKAVWRGAAKAACVFAWGMMKLNIHKQVANRLLEPFQFMHVVLTSTEWQNFYDLRAHPDAQPEIQRLAWNMMEAARLTPARHLSYGEWHLPYVTSEELHSYPTDVLLKLSTARCARVSFLKHDGKKPSVSEDVNLFDRLVGSDPIHASPTEHQAKPLGNIYEQSGNFVGWKQHRKDIECKPKKARV